MTRTVCRAVSSINVPLNVFPRVRLQWEVCMDWILSDRRISNITGRCPRWCLPASSFSMKKWRLERSMVDVFCCVSRWIKPERWNLIINRMSSLYCLHRIITSCLRKLSICINWRALMRTGWQVRLICTALLIRIWHPVLIRWKWRQSIVMDLPEQKSQALK